MQIRSKRDLGIEAIGNSRGDGRSSNEDGSGNFHLDHDKGLNVFEVLEL